MSAHGDRPDEMWSDAAADDLLSALEVIEEQPLAHRAAGYAALHDELSRRLDSGGRSG